jgi:hypothetical protein
MNLRGYSKNPRDQKNSESATAKCSGRISARPLRTKLVVISSSYTRISVVGAEVKFLRLQNPSRNIAQSVYDLLARPWRYE